MPDFNTGTSWDQGLNALGPMLFPDPTKIAQAGLYGAQQRNTKIAGDELQQQMDARNSLPGLIKQLVGDDQYATPGPRLPGPAQQIPAGPWPSQAGMGTGVATVGQPPTAGAPPGALANIMPGAPNQDEQFGSPGLTQPPINTNAPNLVPAAAQAVTQGPLLNKATTGQPPVQSSPAPNSGAPPASNLTTTNGDAPPNDNSSGAFHPASLTAPGGGEKMSGPAAPDGSPAKALDLSQLMVVAARAGYNSDQVHDIAVGVIDKAMQHGVLDHNTGNQMLASLGRGEGLQSDTTMATTALTQGAVTGEAQRQWNQGMMSILDTKTGMVSQISREQYFKNPSAYTAIDPQTGTVLAQQNMGPVNVYAKNLDGTDNPHKVEMIPRWQAIATHRRPAGDVPAIAPPMAGAEKGAQDRDKMLNKAVADMYPTEEGVGAFDAPRTEPAQLTARAKTAVNNLAQEIFEQDPSLSADQKNFGQAQKLAMQRLQKEGYLETPDKIKAKRQRGFSDVGVNVFGAKFGRPIIGTDPALEGTAPDQKFRIDLLKDVPKGPKGSKAQLSAVAQPGAGPQLGNVFQNVKTTAAAPQAQQAVAQPGAAQSGVPVAPGTKEGSVHIDPNTKQPLIVRNGVAVPLSAQEMQQYQAALRAKGQQGAVAGAP